MRKENRKMPNKEVPYQVRDDGRVASGFTASLVTPQECSAGYSEARHGFTLIELLVVVLIIGILTAVALPQYQKSVIKSRYTNLKNLTHSIAQAQEIYYMENNEYADTFEKLTLDMPAGKLDTSTSSEYKYNWGNCRTTRTQVMCRNNAAKMQYQMYLKNLGANGGIRQCVSFVIAESSLQRQVCKSETGKRTSCPSDGYCISEYPN